MGGRDGASTAADSNYRYNPSTNLWEQKTSLLLGVSGPGGTELAAPGNCSGDIIVVGGQSPIPQPTAFTQIYDVATDSWSPGNPLPTALSGLKAAQVADILLAIAGYDGTNTVATAYVSQPVPVELQTFRVE
jgi:N-acetylneuraminic acid mutarotase